MLQLKQLILILVFIVFTMPTIGSAESLVVGIPEGEIINYNDFLKERGKEAREIVSFDSPLLSRSLVSLLLLQRAAYLGGYTARITVEEVPNSARNFALTRSGRFVALGFDVWREAAEKYSDYLYISDPILDSGAFEKGIYGLLSNSELFRAKSLEDLRRCCTILENFHWVVDKKTIREMELPNIVSTMTFQSMIKMLKAGRADFGLFEFGSGPDMSITSFDVTLHAVPGVKVVLRSTRHYAISKKHPEGERFFQAVQKGIANLREQKVFDSAFREIKFINSRVEDWKVLN